MNELEFSNKIKRQLDDHLNLDDATLSRLRAAREQALAHQRMTEPVFVFAWADAISSRFSSHPASFRVAVTGAALVLALIGIQYWQQSPSVEEIEEIDAALLTGDLPINAYLDKGFDAWLKRSPH
jgi:hypothetical protein